MMKSYWTALLAAGFSAAALVPAARAEITGKATLEGDAPEAKEIVMDADAGCAGQHADPVTDPSVIVGEGGALKNVIVGIKTDDPASLGGTPRTEEVVLNQHGCMYEPHVLTLQVGQALTIKNSDPFLHNVHSLASVNPAFNFGQPNVDGGKKVEDAAKAAEFYKVKCDVHPWMSAHIAVFEHPFFAVTGDDGSFKIPGELPDGEYQVVAWHETFGEQTGTATVSGGKAEVNFTFQPTGAHAKPVAKDAVAQAEQTPAAEAKQTEPSPAAAAK